ncbi:MAG: C-GCAxxG-C-C family protein [Candidatus Thorarchaeota archaeon]|jgi:C_GCAxxG_C_C family probable redox protein
MPSEAAKKARALVQEQKVHCAQAVLTAHGEELGSGKIDHETLLKISSAFSGGIARQGNVCGAVTGALMALGLKHGGQDSRKADEVAVMFLREFKTLHGTVNCRELINHDLVTDADVQKAFKTGAFKDCPKFVEDAVVLLEKLL